MRFTITTDGVSRDVDANFITWLACKLLNWHDWRYWRMASSFELAFPDDRTVHRSCARCGVVQCAPEAKSWCAPQEWRGRL